jgi:hypothetical protein
MLPEGTIYRHKGQTCLFKVNSKGNAVPIVYGLIGPGPGEYVNMDYEYAQSNAPVEILSVEGLTKLERVIYGLI